MASPQQTIENVHAGPAWVLIGDPTTASGAGMVELGLCPEVNVKLQVSRQTATNELGQRLRGGIYGWLQAVDISITLQDISAAILAALIDEVSDATTSISASTSLSTLTLGTLCIVPDDVKAAGTGLTSLKTQWCPAVYTVDVGNWIHRLISGGGDDANPYTVQLAAALADVDQDGQAIDPDYAMWFRGSPTDAIDEVTPTAWSLPTDYTT